MEVRVRERLIGALVLVAIVVLIVPAILKGRDDAPVARSEPAPTRRVEVPIGDSTPVPEDQELVPEPLPPDVRPDVAPTPAPGPDVTDRTAKPGVLSPPPPAPMPKPKSSVTDPPAKPQTAPALSATTSAWAVQLGAFSNQSKAEQLVAELRKRRYAAFVLEYRAGGQVLYRVRVGPEQDRARAVEIAARLEKDGFQPVVARHP